MPTDPDDRTRLYAVPIIRMSTDRQANSPGRQRELFSQYCLRYDLLPDGREYYDPGVSATKVPILDRPAIIELLHDAPDARWTVVWFEEYQRAARRGEHLVELENRLRKHGAFLVGPSDNPYALADAHFRKLMLFIGGWRGEGETLDLARRVRDTQVRLVAEGRSISRWLTLGLGWDKSARRWTVDPAGAEAVTRAFRAYAEARSIAGAVRALNADGYPSPRGGRWHASTICRLIKHPAYRGHLRLKGVVYPQPEGTVPEIVPRDLVQEVDRLLALQEGRPRRAASSATERAVFAGLLRCPGCGGWLTTTVGSGRVPGGTRRYLNYRCARAYSPTPSCDWRHHVAQGRLERELVPVLAERLREHRPAVRSRPRQDRQLAQRQEELQSERERWLTLYTTGRITEARLDAELGRVDGLLGELRLREPARQVEELTVSEARGFARLLTKVWPTLTIPERREILQTMLVSVTPDLAALPNSPTAWRRL